MPIARFATMKTSATTQEQKNAALHRHVKEEVGRDQNDRDLDVADENVRHDFPNQHFARPRRHRKKIFHRAALALPRDREAGDHHHRHGQDHAHQPGHDVVLGNDFGVVERVDA